MHPRALLVLDGDGIGPEIMQATLAVLDAVAPALSRPLEFTRMEIGFATLKTQGTPT